MSSIVTEVQDSYAGLAKFMGPNFQAGMGQFKRFGELQALNLLYMQAELIKDEEVLRVQAFLDRTNGDEKEKKFDKEVWEMIGSSSSSQWRKVLEVREKLKEYSKDPSIIENSGLYLIDEAVLRQAEMLKLEKPTRYDFGMLKDWLMNPKGGNMFLRGCESKPYMRDEVSDLISVANRSKQDGLTRFVERRFLPWLGGKILNRGRFKVKWILLLRVRIESDVNRGHSRARKTPGWEKPPARGSRV